MATAKDVRIAPIKASDAAALIRRVHYSGKVVNNSQLHLGAFLDGRLEGAMSFGPSLDKRKMQGLVRDTPWNGFLELNRMAFSERLPRNSESRAIGVAFRMIRKAYPHIQWVVSFSDATQCGDGTIYRASGFLLTGIKANNQIIEFPDGRRETRFVLTGGAPAKAREIAAMYGARMGGGSTLKPFLDIGAKALPGFQLRYMAFLDPTALDRLTVPVLPFSKIEEMGAGMYLGHQTTRVKQAIDGDQPNSGGATPTHTLQSQDGPA